MPRKKDILAENTNRHIGVPQRPPTASIATKHLRRLAKRQQEGKAKDRLARQTRDPKALEQVASMAQGIAHRRRAFGEVREAIIKGREQLQEERDKKREERRKKEEEIMLQRQEAAAQRVKREEERLKREAEERKGGAPVGGGIVVAHVPEALKSATLISHKDDEKCSKDVVGRDDGEWTLVSVRSKKESRKKGHLNNASDPMPEMTAHSSAPTPTLSVPSPKTTPSKTDPHLGKTTEQPDTPQDAIDLKWKSVGAHWSYSENPYSLFAFPPTPLLLPTMDTENSGLTFDLHSHLAAENKRLAKLWSESRQQQWLTSAELARLTAENDRLGREVRSLQAQLKTASDQMVFLVQFYKLHQTTPIQSSS